VVVKPSESGFLPRGLRLVSKRELVEVLANWLTESRSVTIGDVGTYGGKPWLRIEMNGHEVVLNADTTRAAVQEFVRSNAPDPDRPWQVVVNRRGRINKVLPGPGNVPLPGWYAYLTHPLTTTGTL
jgi:hypothetical protein